MNSRRSPKDLARYLVDNASAIVAVACLVVCVLIGVLGFFGFALPAEKTMFLVLALLPLIAYVLFDRLRVIERRVADRSQYFDNSRDVISELIKMCRRENDYILATGARTKKPLIDAIQEVVTGRGVSYSRFLTSRTVTQDLDGHLKWAETEQRCQIKCAEMFQCPNFWVTSSQVMIILPIPVSGRFRGVLLKDANAVIQYHNYFFELFYGDKAVDLDAFGVQVKSGGVS